MDRMNLPADSLVSFDFSDETTPVYAQALEPTVYKDGDSFCCLFGPDPQSGIFGCGTTPHEAVQNWSAHLQAAIEKPGQPDAIVKYAMDMLNGSAT